MTHWILSLGIAAALLATTTACTGTFLRRPSAITASALACWAGDRPRTLDAPAGRVDPAGSPPHPEEPPGTDPIQTPRTRTRARQSPPEVSTRTATRAPR